MLIRYTALENAHREPVKMSLKRKGVIAPHDHRLHPQRKQTEGAHALRTCRPSEGGRGAASRPELEKRRVSRGSGGSETRIFGEVRVLKKPADDRGAAGPA